MKAYFCPMYKVFERKTYFVEPLIPAEYIVCMLFKYPFVKMF